jgi:WD40 repeat protein
VKIPACPYVGPRTFREGERLHGRAQELEELVDLLISERIVLLYSPSGAGKSSLLYAGLVPEMKRRGFRVHPVLRVNNLGALALDTLLEKEPNGELLIFDQFEEIITSDPLNYAAKEQFFKQIGSALRDSNRWALFAMREDYLAAIDRYRRWVPTRLSNTYRLDFLSLQASYEAMQAPARTKGIVFTDEAAKQIADDLSEVNVPKAGGGTAKELGEYIQPVQLQVVCLRRWQELPEGTTTILPTSQKQIGSVALADYYADTVAAVAKISAIPERDIRNWFDDQLITVIRTRAQVPIGEEVSGDLKNTAIAPLVEAHLVRSDESRGAKWYELAHDRLIEPVLKNNEEWRKKNLSLLQREAELWDEQRRPPDRLLRAASLADAREWAAANKLLPREQDFLDASIGAEDRRLKELRQTKIMRRLTVGMFALFIGGVAATLLALSSKKETAIVLASSDVASVGRVLGDGNPAQALALLARALRGNAADPEARAWASALLSWGQPVIPASELDNGSPIKVVAFSQWGSHVLTAPESGKAQIWDAATGKKVSVPIDTPATLPRSWLSPDGLYCVWIPAGTKPLRYRVYDTQTGAEKTDIHDDRLGALNDEPMQFASFTADGRLLTISQKRAVLWDFHSSNRASSPQFTDIQSGWLSADGAMAFLIQKQYMAAWDFLNRGDLSGVVLNAAVQKPEASSDHKNVVYLESGIPRLWKLSETDSHPLDDISRVNMIPQGIGFTKDNQSVVVYDLAFSVWNPIKHSLTDDWKLTMPLVLAQFQSGQNAFLESGTSMQVLRDTQTWQEKARLMLPSEAKGQSLSPDGSMIVTTMGSTIAQVWRTAGPAGPTFLPASTSAPDGTLPAVSHNGAMKLDVRGFGVAVPPELIYTSSGNLRQRFNLQGTVGPYYATFSSDDLFIAIWDSVGLIQVFNTKTGQRLGLPLRVQEPILGVDFGKDSTKLLAATRTRTAAWDFVLGSDSDAAAIADLAEAVGGLRMSSGTDTEVIPLEARRAKLKGLKSNSPDVQALIQRVQQP